MFLKYEESKLPENNILQPEQKQAIVFKRGNRAVLDLTNLSSLSRR